MNTNREITVYEPGYKHKIGFFKIWFVMIRNIVRSKDLIVQLFKRDFIAVYKQAFLGVTWVFIAPLIVILQWILMNATGVLQPGDTGKVPYPVYVLISMAVWGMFDGFFKASMKTLEVAKGFILQVKFPHEALITKQAAEYLATFMISFTFAMGVLLFYGEALSVKALLFPIMVIPLFFISTGIGLLFSIPNVITKEIAKIVDVLINLLLFVTPVIYSPNVEHPLLKQIIYWNPLSYLVGTPRNLLLYGNFDNMVEFGYASLFAFIVFMISWRLFYLSEDKVIEKMI